MSTYIPKKDLAICILNPSLPLNHACLPGECKLCGWNPEVHAMRLQAIAEISSHGKLREWGKKDVTACE